jgi:hypothetical protein
VSISAYVNLCLLCFESCPPSADLYFGYLNLSASGGFVSDFELRISDLPSYSLTLLRILSVFSEFTRHCLGGPSVAKEFLVLGQKADLPAPCKQLAGVRLRRICISVI